MFDAEVGMVKIHIHPLVPFYLNHQDPILWLYVELC